MKKYTWTKATIARWNKQTFPSATTQEQRLKLLKEAQEYFQAQTYEERIQELADYYIVSCAPPFNLSYEFILQGLRLADKCLALFLPIRYLTGKSRAEIYKQNPPTKIVVIPNKVDFLGNGSPVMEFAWFIWEKGKQRSEIVWAEWNGVK